jgi:hypothetical protein
MAWSPEYCEVDELAAFVKIPDDTDDTQLGLAIAAASRAIDRLCRRQFGLVAAPEERRYVARRRCGYWVVDIDDLQTTTGLLVAGLAVVDPEFYPLNAAADGKPWTALEVDETAMDVRYRVAVTARWGWTTVPDTVKEACLLQASRVFARRGAPFGIAGSPDTGSELRLLAKLDPDVVVMLEDYRRKARPR